MTALNVNWFRRNVEASSIYFPPDKFLSVYKTVKTKHLNPTTNVLSCPAVLKRRRSLYVVRCPYDLRLRYIGEPGEGRIHVIHPGTSIVDEKIRSIFAMSGRDDWADPKTPVFQLLTPYVFSTVEPLDICQLNNPMDFGRATGFRLIEGRFPIDKWLRPLSFAVEWIDTNSDIVFKRGEPWFCLEFLPRENTELSVRLIEIQESPELASQIVRNAGVTSYIKGTSSLFHRSE